MISTFPYYGGKQLLCRKIAGYLPKTGVERLIGACGG